FDQIWQQFQNELEQQGQKMEDLDESEDDLRAEYKGIAERRVRTGLVLAEVGSKNEIEVTQEELNQGLIQRVQQFPGQEQQVFEYFQKNPEAMAQIRAPLFEEKDNHAHTPPHHTDPIPDRRAPPLSRPRRSADRCGYAAVSAARRDFHTDNLPPDRDGFRASGLPAGRRRNCAHAWGIRAGRHSIRYTPSGRDNRPAPRRSGRCPAPPSPSGRASGGRRRRGAPPDR
ncbi:MAG: hypothetical protein EBT71_08110, partial [Alphaproteobacteria bacterium]|nr:hypothetical protein [Alphaproteobacteria bacterium]